MQPARLRTIIVDDEPLAREGLRAELDAMTHDGGIDIVAECGSTSAACDAIRLLRPELLLLDVEMPELDGFAVLERLEPEEVPPAVVFVTAYDVHALKAFEAHALDFVLKPVTPARLRAAVDRSRARVREVRVLAEHLSEPPAAAAAPPYLDRILVPERGRTLVIRTDEIDWIEAETYYVRIHAGNASRLLRERMSVLEARLDPASFVRVHRSAIVKLSRVREIRSPSKYEHEALLTTGARVRVARDRRARLDALLKGARGR